MVILGSEPYTWYRNKRVFLLLFFPENDQMIVNIFFYSGCADHFWTFNSSPCCIYKSVSSSFNQ